MDLYSEEHKDELHDYLVKIGSYEMIFEKQKTMIHALTQMNKSLADGCRIEQQKAEKLMQELEEYDNLINGYHKQFLN